MKTLKILPKDANDKYHFCIVDENTQNNLCQCDTLDKSDFWFKSALNNFKRKIDFSQGDKIFIHWKVLDEIKNNEYLMSKIGDNYTTYKVEPW